MSDRDAQALSEQATRASERFREVLAARLTLRRDHALLGELAEEARPVIYALLEGLAHPPARGARPEASSLREAVALASLLGRRAAHLGGTPSAALEIVPALLAAIEAPVPESLAGSLGAVCVEGFVAAREEALEEAAARRHAEAIPMVEIAPRCFAVFFGGAHVADELERAIERIGQRLLKRDARAILAHCGGLLDPERETAAQLFALQATCRMLGVVCVFSAVDEAWWRAARERGVAVEELTLAPDFASGLSAVLDACGLELRHRSGLGGVLRRLVGRPPEE